MLKTRIKECSIRHSIKRRRNLNSELESLEKELEEIDNNVHVNDDILNRKEIIKNRLHEIYSHLTEGAKLRAKIDNVNEVESNSNYFKNIEKSRQGKNVIHCLTDDNGSDITDQQKILKMIGKYYENLYSSIKVDECKINDMLNNVHIENVITEQQKRYLDKMPTLEEFDIVIKLPKDKKSPGLDGLGIEVYRKFWDKLKYIYYNMIIESWDIGILPFSTRTSVLSTLYKSDTRKKLSNYRPLSLTNCDYKILTFLFANRLSTVLGDIINFDQVAYIKNRYIGCSIRNIIDLYEYCENNNQAGAMLCMDFEKAYDSIEHTFVNSVLKRFNFGNNFIKWINILYNDARFKVKNNGWISKSYKMERGLRQGCSLSSLIFIIMVEILGNLIRQNENIKGITVDGKEHKVIQYADMTVCVENTNSIDTVIEIMHEFKQCSGLKLNFKKTKGIWLGKLKDYGLRTYKNISWTGNPVKCLGIYIGHNKEKCYKLNWQNKLNKIENILQQWHKRKLSLYGKVEVLKTYVLPKITYSASVLTVSKEISQNIKKLFFYFLWGKRDKVKRSHVIRKQIEGGLNMIDIDSYFSSLKAAWISRLINSRGKWSDMIHFYLKKISLPLEYLIKTSFRKIQNFPIIKTLPEFYQDIIITFNKIKTIKPFNSLNKHEIIQQPIWGNEYFRVGETCLYIKGWIQNNIFYVKDLFTDRGILKNDKSLYDLNIDKCNALQSVFILKNHVLKALQKHDLSIAPYVRISNMRYFVSKNKIVSIEDSKSRMYYDILVSKVCSRGHMESIFSNEFNFSNNLTLWKTIYNQKCVILKIPKLKEFCYKMLQNIVPCGVNLSKWNKNIPSKCEFCQNTETTKHMLFECSRIKDIWETISNVLNVNVRWKQIVCGFINCDQTIHISFINYVITIVAYAIFKENSYCKFNSSSYKESNLLLCVKQNIQYYTILLKEVDPHIGNYAMLKKLNDSL